MNERAVAIAIAASMTVLSAVQAAGRPTAQVERGRDLFARVGCYYCHGYQGQGGALAGTPGGAGPKLAPDPPPLAFMVQFLRTTTTMPRYSEKILSEADIADIHAYLSSISPSTPVERIPALRNLTDH